MLEQHLKDMEWEHEVLQQRFQQVQKERDELYDRFEGVVAEVEQRAGFKNLLLEKKLVALQDALQKRDVQLGEVRTWHDPPSFLGYVQRGKMETLACFFLLFLLGAWLKGA